MRCLLFDQKSHGSFSLELIQILLDFRFGAYNFLIIQPILALPVLFSSETFYAETETLITQFNLYFINHIKI